DISVVSGPLQLAAKYELRTLRDRLADGIKSCWPETLAEWTEREETLHLMRSRAKIKQPEIWPKPNLAIRLGYDAGVRSILPAAFYNL
ncbi:hypothetical protein BC835DRAFT_1229394, partial [Cytidiella melzeri]